MSRLASTYVHGYVEARGQPWMVSSGFQSPWFLKLCLTWSGIAQIDQIVQAGSPTDLWVSTSPMLRLYSSAILSSFKFFNNAFITICVCIYHSMHVEDKGQLVRVDSLLLSCGCQRSSPDHQAWQEVHLSIKSSYSSTFHVDSENLTQVLFFIQKVLYQLSCHPDPISFSSQSLVVSKY